MKEIIVGSELTLHFIKPSLRESFIKNVLSGYGDTEHGIGTGYIDVYHLTWNLSTTYILPTVGEDYSLLTQPEHVVRETEEQYTGLLENDVLAVLNHYRYFTADIDENDYPGFKLSGRLYNVPIVGVW